MKRWEDSSYRKIRRELRNGPLRPEDEEGIGRKLENLWEGILSTAFPREASLKADEQQKKKKQGDREVTEEEKAFVVKASKVLGQQFDAVSRLLYAFALDGVWNDSYNSGNTGDGSRRTRRWRYDDEFLENFCQFCHDEQLQYLAILESLLRALSPSSGSSHGSLARRVFARLEHDPSAVATCLDRVLALYQEIGSQEMPGGGDLDYAGFKNWPFPERSRRENWAGYQVAKMTGLLEVAIAAPYGALAVGQRLSPQWVERSLPMLASGFEDSGFKSFSLQSAVQSVPELQPKRKVLRVRASFANLQFWLGVDFVKEEGENILAQVKAVQDGLSTGLYLRESSMQQALVRLLWTGCAAVLGGPKERASVENISELALEGGGLEVLLECTDVANNECDGARRHHYKELGKAALGVLTRGFPAEVWPCPRVLIDLFVRIFTHDAPLSEQYLQHHANEPYSLLNYASRRFPYELLPLLRMATSLASNSDLACDVYHRLSHLSSLTIPYTFLLQNAPPHLTATIVQQLKLGPVVWPEPFELYHIGIPAGARMQLIYSRCTDVDIQRDDPSNGSSVRPLPGFVEIEVPESYSMWRLCLDEILDPFLDSALRMGRMSSDSRMESVIAFMGLLAEVLAQQPILYVALQLENDQRRVLGRLVALLELGVESSMWRLITAVLQALRAIFLADARDVVLALSRKPRLMTALFATVARSAYEKDGEAAAAALLRLLEEVVDYLQSAAYILLSGSESVRWDELRSSITEFAANEALVRLAALDSPSGWRLASAALALVDAALLRDPAEAGLGGESRAQGLRSLLADTAGARILRSLAGAGVDALQSRSGNDEEADYEALVLGTLTVVLKLLIIRPSLDPVSVSPLERMLLEPTGTPSFVQSLSQYLHYPARTAALAKISLSILTQLAHVPVDPSGRATASYMSLLGREEAEALRHAVLRLLTSSRRISIRVELLQFLSATLLHQPALARLLLLSQNPSSSGIVAIVSGLPSMKQEVDMKVPDTNPQAKEWEEEVVRMAAALELLATAWDAAPDHSQVVKMVRDALNPPFWSSLAAWLNQSLHWARSAGTARACGASLSSVAHILRIAMREMFYVPRDELSSEFLSAFQASLSVGGWDLLIQPEKDVEAEVACKCAENTGLTLLQNYGGDARWLRWMLPGVLEAEGRLYGSESYLYDVDGFRRRSLVRWLDQGSVVVRGSFADSSGIQLLQNILLNESDPWANNLRTSYLELQQNLYAANEAASKVDARFFAFSALRQLLLTASARQPLAFKKLKLSNLQVASRLAGWLECLPYSKAPSIAILWAHELSALLAAAVRQAEISQEELADVLPRCLNALVAMSEGPWGRVWERLLGTMTEIVRRSPHSAKLFRNSCISNLLAYAVTQPDLRSSAGLLISQLFEVGKISDGGSESLGVTFLMQLLEGGVLIRLLDCVNGQKRRVVGDEPGGGMYRLTDNWEQIVQQGCDMVSFGEAACPSERRRRWARQWNRSSVDLEEQESREEESYRANVERVQAVYALAQIVGTSGAAIEHVLGEVTNSLLSGESSRRDHEGLAYVKVGRGLRRAPELRRWAAVVRFSAWLLLNTQNSHVIEEVARFCHGQSRKLFSVLATIDAPDLSLASLDAAAASAELVAAMALMTHNWEWMLPEWAALFGPRMARGVVQCIDGLDHHGNPTPAVAEDEIRWNALSPLVAPLDKAALALRLQILHRLISALLARLLASDAPYFSREADSKLAPIGTLVRGVKVIDALLTEIRGSLSSEPLQSPSLTLNKVSNPGNTPPPPVDGLARLPTPRVLESVLLDIRSKITAAIDISFRQLHSLEDGLRVLQDLNNLRV